MPNAENTVCKYWLISAFFCVGQAGWHHGGQLEQIVIMGPIARGGGVTHHPAVAHDGFRGMQHAAYVFFNNIFVTDDLIDGVRFLTALLQCQYILLKVGLGSANGGKLFGKAAHRLDHKRQFDFARALQ